MDAPTRVLMALNLEEPDRVPAFESAFTNNTIMKHYGLDPGAGIKDGYESIKRLPGKDRLANWAFSNQKWLAQSMVDGYELLRRLKIDIGLSYVTHTYRKGIEGGYIDEFGRIMNVDYYDDGTLILGYRGGYLKSFEDYEKWKQPSPHEKRRLAAFRAGKQVQEQMNNEILSVPAIGGMMEPSWEPFGIEVFSRILAKPKQAKKVFDDRGYLALELVKILAENGAELVLIWDDYGFKNGLFMSPRNFNTYVLPWLKRICDAAHKQDCKILLHSDGDLSMIFNDIVDCGIDAIHPIEPTTANPDYDIFSLAEKYGDSLTFVGNISPVMLATGDISEIKEYSKRLIKEIAPGGGYFFSSGHSIVPSVTLDRWQAIMDIREKYGTYPINIPD
ncbi:MAG: uroporphyrinogen decarboxylase family protein [Candidatus Thorarchaeota archaeon]